MLYTIVGFVEEGPFHVVHYRAAEWIGYYRLLPDIIRYFPYSFKIYELLGQVRMQGGSRAPIFVISN